MSSRSPTDDVEIEFPQANIVAAKAIGGALASTMGPSASDSLIVTKLESEADKAPGQAALDEYSVTDDGATILESLPIEHPMAPVIKRIVGPERPGTTDVVGESIPDGISSTVVFLAALLDEAESLMERGVHPTAIQRGYRIGLEETTATLESLTRPLDSFPDERAACVDVARSAMTGNDVGGQRNRWAKLAVEAVEHVGMPDEESFGVRQFSAGSMADSRLVHGTVLDRNQIVDDRMPKRLEDASILVLEGHTRGNVSDGMTGGLQDPNVQRDGERIQVESPDDVAKFDRVFSDRRERIVVGLAEAGVDVVVTKLGISTEFQDLLVEHGIVGIRGVNRLKLTQLAQAVGANKVRDPSDVTPSDLGYAGVVEQRLAEKRKGRRRRRRMVVFDECPNPDSVTVLLHGVSGKHDEQASTTVRKGAAAAAVASGRSPRRGGVVPGGGAPEIQIAAAVRDRATAEDSRSQLALTAYADATERLVFGLAKNAGLDPLDTLSDVRARSGIGAADGAGTGGRNVDGDGAIGLVLPSGAIDDVVSAGILDPVATRLRCFEAAVDVASMILRIDDAIDSTDTMTPSEPGDTIYDEHAEKHHDYLEEKDDDETIWDT